jgi:alanine racemase
MTAQAKCIIDLNAIKHNLQQIKNLAQGQKIIAMVKSNAYGHGLLEICQQLGSEITLGLIEIADALKLRENNFTQNIILMTGPSSEEDVIKATKYDLDLVLHHTYQIKLLQQARIDKPIVAWLKINTGMNRLGFTINEAVTNYNLLLKDNNIATVNIISHLSSPDDPGSSACTKQLSNIKKLNSVFPNAEFSFYNSAGLLNNLNPKANWVRPGVMLYGISPLQDKSAAELNLQPAMTLQAPIISIHKVNKGDCIGYGATYECLQDMTIACIKLGYGDGYLRCTKAGTPVKYKNILCPLVGRVSMNMITVDISKVATAKINDLVTIWGDGLPIETIAAGANTIAYELITRLNPEIKKEYKKSELGVIGNNMNQIKMPELDAVLWMCRRGMLELDLILNGFTRDCYKQLHDTQKNQLISLLSYDDPVLYDILVKKTKTPGASVAEIVTMINQHILNPSAKFLFD